MQIYDIDINQNITENFAVALGNFDGIHKGHAKLIRRMVKSANERALKPSVLLFKNHTRSHDILILTGTEQKISILKKLGVETIFLKSFDKSLMEMSPNTFIEDILINKINSKIVVVGFDYRFGHKASGNAEMLKEICMKYGTDVIIEDPVLYDNLPISSSSIREMISNGNIEDANKLLEYNFSLVGTVVDGRKQGRVFGFPTANLELSENYVLPKNGVYHTHVHIKGETFTGLTSVGFNPTVSDDEIIKIETYILDFSRNVYGEKIEVEFLRFIREEIKFDDVNLLTEQMKNDLKTVKTMLYI